MDIDINLCEISILYNIIWFDRLFKKVCMVGDKYCQGITEKTYLC